MATIGGATAHADPNLDTPLALMAMDGQIVARSQRSQRTIPTDRFFTGYYSCMYAERSPRLPPKPHAQSNATCSQATAEALPAGVAAASPVRACGRCRGFT